MILTEYDREREDRLLFAQGREEGSLATMANNIRKERLRRINKTLTSLLLLVVAAGAAS